MKTVNERTSVILLMKFTDENKVAVIPDSGQYQITDELTSTILTSWTSFIPITTSYSLAINQTNNRILDDTNEIEVRIVSVVTQYAGSTRQCTEEFRYEVKNLRCVPPALVLAASGGGIGGGVAAILGHHV
jgi:hypothetical protein